MSLEDLTNLHPLQGEPQSTQCAVLRQLVSLTRGATVGAGSGAGRTEAAPAFCPAPGRSIGPFYLHRELLDAP